MALVDGAAERGLNVAANLHSLPEAFGPRYGLMNRANAH
jgi:hypothetical protein